MMIFGRNCIRLGGSMDQDLTKGSITKGLLLFALPMVAGTVGSAGIWAAIPIGWFLADAVGYVYYFQRKQHLLSGQTQ